MANVLPGDPTLYRVIHTADRDDWLERRRDRIGASEVASICGIGPWANATRTLRVKLGQEAVEDPLGKMAMGHTMEPIILGLYAKTTSGACQGLSGAIYQSTRYPWLACTPDAVEVAPDGSQTVLEIKHTVVHPMWLRGYGTPEQCEARLLRVAKSLIEGPKEEHVYQVNAQMMVLGLERMRLVYCFGTPPLQVWDVEADPFVQAHIETACVKWWAKYRKLRG